MNSVELSLSLTFFANVVAQKVSLSLHLLMAFKRVLSKSEVSPTIRRVLKRFRVELFTVVENAVGRLEVKHD